MKKIIALLLVVVMCAALFAGCGEKPADNGGEKGGYKIALCNFSLGETWRYQMQAEWWQAADALKEQGVISEWYETNAEGEASKQVADMQDLIAKGVDGILIAPVNATACNDVISEAMAAGIKVVVFNSGVDPSFTDYTAYVYQDNFDFGVINAQFVVDALGEEGGKVIALQGVAGNEINATRWAGAKSVFDKNPQIEIIAEANGNWDYADGKAATEALLSAHPEIDAVWSQGGAMTQGAIDAFVAAGRDLVPMSGESGNGFMASWKKYIPEGFTSCAPIYDCAMVVDALDVLIRALNGEEVPKDCKLEMGQVTAENLDEHYRPDLPDTYWAGTRLTDENLKKLFSTN